MVLAHDGRPILDLLSLGRSGPSGHLTSAQVGQIRRTVTRVPEAIVRGWLTLLTALIFKGDPYSLSRCAYSRAIYHAH